MEFGLPDWMFCLESVESKGRVNIKMKGLVLLVAIFVLKNVI
jgi:hypothetical protein